MAMMKPKSDQPRDSAAKLMGHVLALNKDHTIGKKNNNQPPRGRSDITAFAKGGKACAPKAKMAAGGAAKTRLKSPMPKPIKKVTSRGG